MITYMVGKLATICKIFSWKGLFRAVHSPNWDKFAIPPPPKVERLSSRTCSILVLMLSASCVKNRPTFVLSASYVRVE